MAVSGGVDSSLAAHLLSRKSADIIGNHLSNLGYRGGDGTRVGNKIGRIPKLLRITCKLPLCIRRIK
jgi:tRNA U34 2-thiouridine synthase MnmA/TrmU